MMTSAPARCPRCSSPATSEEPDLVVYLCGTEVSHDALDGWDHDWSQDALAVCDRIAKLQDELAYCVGLPELAEQLRNALAFARSCILSGESWSETCDEVIDGALTAARLKL